MTVKLKSFEELAFLKGVIQEPVQDSIQAGVQAKLTPLKQVKRPSLPFPLSFKDRESQGFSPFSINLFVTVNPRSQ